MKTEWIWGMKKREGPKIKRAKKMSADEFGEKKQYKKKGILDSRTC